MVRPADSTHDILPAGLDTARLPGHLTAKLGQLRDLFAQLTRSRAEARRAAKIERQTIRAEAKAAAIRKEELERRERIVKRKEARLQAEAEAREQAAQRLVAAEISLEDQRRRDAADLETARRKLDAERERVGQIASEAAAERRMAEAGVEQSRLREKAIDRKLAESEAAIARHRREAERLTKLAGRSRAEFVANRKQARAVPLDPVEVGPGRASRSHDLRPLLIPGAPIDSSDDAEEIRRWREELTAHQNRLVEEFDALDRLREEWSAEPRRMAEELAAQAAELESESLRLAERADEVETMRGDLQTQLVELQRQRDDENDFLTAVAAISDEAGRLRSLVESASLALSPAEAELRAVAESLRGRLGEMAGREAELGDRERELILREIGLRQLLEAWEAAGRRPGDGPQGVRAPREATGPAARRAAEVLAGAASRIDAGRRAIDGGRRVLPAGARPGRRGPIAARFGRVAEVVFGGGRRTRGAQVGGRGIVTPVSIGASARRARRRSRGRVEEPLDARRADAPTLAGELLMSRIVLALDLERTLIDDALSGQPRPGLREFLAFCQATFARVVIFTTVDEADAREVMADLDSAGHLPPHFREGLDFIDWAGEYKDLAFVPGAPPAEIILVDDDAGWIRSDQRDSWIPIAPWDGGPDGELIRVRNVLEQLKGDISPSEPEA